MLVRLSLIVVVAAIAGGLGAGVPAAVASDAATGEASRAAEIVPVEVSKVCMMNDQLFEREMIPVEVDGETYFGCCEMCKARLAVDAGLRRATDPVSGRSVDKASAVAGALPDGRVLYFESRDNLDRLAQRLRQAP